MLVWLAARLSCSAWGGGTSLLTTCTMMGLPSASFLKSWPAESTSIFCSKVWVRVPRLPLPPGELPEIRMSTRMPGTTKPATPTTSLTFTATARIPGGIIAAMPPPAPLGARRDAMIGSLAKMAVMTPRPMMSLIWLVAPTGMDPGQSATLTSSSFNTVPTSRSLVASATCASAGPAMVVAGRLISTRYSTRLAPAATRNANVKTPKNRLFIWIPASPGSIYRHRLPENTGHGPVGKQLYQPLPTERVPRVGSGLCRGLSPVSRLLFPGHAGDDRQIAGMPRDRWLAAFASVVFVVAQILLMLPPAPMKRAAEANATNAKSRVYSIRSWP